MLKFIHKKEKYLDCPFLKYSLHFFHDEIRACCSNVKGPVYYSEYDGKIPFNPEYIYKKRKEYRDKINSPFNNKIMPEECEGCYLAKDFFSGKKIEKFDNKTDTLFIQNNMSCNAKCIYCVFKDVERGYKYEVVPIIKTLLKNNLLDKNCKLNLSGGEITITPDFEELVSLLTQHLNSQIFLSTSGIKYSKAVENAFKVNKCWQTISIDSGTRETYKKIKQTDCFDKVKDNLKKYTQASNYAKECTILKYILIDGINDNEEEINEFFKLVNDLEIKNVRIDVNYEVYTCNNNKLVPEHQIELIKYFNGTAEKYGITAHKNEQTEAILNKNRINTY